MSVTAAGIPVRLSTEEVAFVALAGALRRALALGRGLTDRYGQVDTDAWSQDIEGVAAELAVAKVLRRYYIPALHVQRHGDADVGPYQVRSTQHENGCLLIKDGDRDDEAFVLVIGSVPDLRVAGWLWAGAGKRPEWRRNVRGREAFFVPQPELKPMPDVNHRKTT